MAHLIRFDISHYLLAFTVLAVPSTANAQEVEKPHVNPIGESLELEKEVINSLRARRRSIRHIRRMIPAIPFQTFVRPQWVCSDPPHTIMMGYRPYTGIKWSSVYIVKKSKASWIFNVFNHSSTSPAYYIFDIICAAPKGKGRPNYHVTTTESASFSLNAQDPLSSAPIPHECLEDTSEVLGIEPIGGMRDQHYLARSIEFSADRSIWTLVRMINTHRKSPQRPAPIIRHEMKFKFFCGNKIRDN